MSHTKLRLNDKGFTLIELLVAVILSGIVVTIFIASLMTMVTTAVLQKTQLELSQQIQIALDTIERDIRIANAFDTTPIYSTIEDEYGPENTNQGWSGEWSYKGNGNNNRALILRHGATTVHPLSINRTPVFARGTLVNPYAEQDVTLNCTVYNATTSPTGALSYNPKLQYYLIYFVRDSTLYRRTLTDTSTALCDGQQQYQKQSCPSIDDTRPASCQANDELIVRNVAEFTIAYYSQDDQASPTDINAYASSDDSILEEIRNVVVSIQLEKTVANEVLHSTLAVRASRVN